MQRLLHCGRVLRLARVVDRLICFYEPITVGSCSPVHRPNHIPAGNKTWCRPNQHLLAFIFLQVCGNGPNENPSLLFTDALAQHWIACPLVTFQMMVVRFYFSSRRSWESWFDGPLMEGRSRLKSSQDFTTYLYNRGSLDRCCCCCCRWRVKATNWRNQWTQTDYYSL